MDKVLVLNADYTPLNVTSLRRGFVLVIKGKAEILENVNKSKYYENRSINRRNC
jgi:hypothetical protein